VRSSSSSSSSSFGEEQKSGGGVKQERSERAHALLPRSTPGGPLVCRLAYQNGTGALNTVVERR
jgi:hypothetical protein